MKRIVFGIILVCAGILTGCTQLASMSEQESDIIAEYMAGTYLKHSGYENALIYTKEEETLDVNEISSGLNQSEEGTTPTESVNNQDDTDNNLNNSTGNTTENNADNETQADNSTEQSQELGNVASINDIIGLEDFDINYSDYTLLDSYPSKIGDNYFNLEPTSGNQLLIVNFTVKNITDKTKNFNLIEHELKYTLSNQAGESYLPILTLLTEDMQFINLDIAAGEIYNAVVVYDVPKDVNTSDISLSIANTDKNTMIAVN
ncbi:MAG: hypothetical protein K0R92_735 [Lachnospiraceae bacterium]|nr:hypothetical protein [Lachnospiraceae bacterium]